MRMKNLLVIAGALMFIVLMPAVADITPAAVTDPDRKVSQRLDLPRVRLTKPGSIRVTGGDAYYEQAIVVWRVNNAASMVEVGQLARGTKAKGRPGGDASHRPQVLVLPEAGDYYFGCWHKVEPDAGRADSPDITQVPWSRSAEKLSGSAKAGWTLACDDTSARDDFNDIVAEIHIN